MIWSGRFEGRTAIVTGGGSGLGRRIARRIVAEGGAVMLWDADAAALAEAKDEVATAHARAVDVADHDMVMSAAAEAHRAFGTSIDILVNAAGITGPTAPVDGYPVDAWRRVIDVNLTGVFHCCREVMSYMSGGSGRIVNVASVAGKEGNPNAAAYSASKAAVTGFTKSLAKELAPRGILVNALAPTAFDSPMLAGVPQSHIDYMRARIPLGRLGTLDENAAMACFMASDECSFTTGAVFDTSGGRTTY